jgi:hypothetical protein
MTYSVYPDYSQTDVHKTYRSLELNNENNNRLLHIHEQEAIRNLEIDWIGGIKDQVDFANNHLTKYKLRLQICPTRTTEI